MEKEFVSYEQAVALKELGFDEECLKWYTAMGRFIEAGKSNQPDYLPFACSAPLKQQVFRWFREKYGLYSHVRESWSFDDTLEYVSQINGVHVNHGISDKPINRFDSYEEAENACIDKLIELAKQS